MLQQFKEWFTSCSPSCCSNTKYILYNASTIFVQIMKISGIQNNIEHQNICGFFCFTEEIVILVWFLGELSLLGFFFKWTIKNKLLIPFLYEEPIRKTVFSLSVFCLFVFLSEGSIFFFKGSCSVVYHLASFPAPSIL